MDFSGEETKTKRQKYIVSKTRHEIPTKNNFFMSYTMEIYQS